MYIKIDDFLYFEGLFKALTVNERRKWLRLLKISCKESTEFDYGRFIIITDENYKEMRRAKKKVLTRGKLNKAYASCVKSGRTEDKGQIVAFRKHSKIKKNKE